MVDHRDRERVHPGTAAEWWSWLDQHHADRSGVWLVTWKTATGRPRMTYEESVVAALAYGWVDGPAATLDGERSMLWFAPRKPKSGWSRPNKERIARLEAEGRLAPAGRRAVEVARANGAWSLLDDVENLVVPEDLAAAFDERPPAREHWDAFPRSVRRGILEWIVQAKRAETRARRITETADRAARGERANQWTRR